MRTDVTTVKDIPNFKKLSKSDKDRIRTALAENDINEIWIRPEDGRQQFATWQSRVCPYGRPWRQIYDVVLWN